MDVKSLGDPLGLAAARAMAHGAAQLLYRAASANVAPMPGDEHTNLGWHSEGLALRTHPLDGSGAMAELTFAPLSLLLGGNALPLDGVTTDQALAWLDGQLAAIGLHPASSVAIPYDLPQDVLSIQRFAQIDGLSALAAWFDLAASALQSFATSMSDLTPPPGAVRCWPHHFDIATYVGLETGDPEHAKGIGVGMSPGDGSYVQPYFYVNPWPHLDRARLPAAIEPGHWHIEGFVGSVALGVEILTLSDVASGTERFLSESFKVGRAALGA